MWEVISWLAQMIIAIVVITAVIDSFGFFAAVILAFTYFLMGGK